MQRAEQTRDAVKVIAVKVSDENRVDPAPLHARAHQLQLRTLTTVEQEDIAFTHERRRRQAPGQRWDRGAGSE